MRQAYFDAGVKLSPALSKRDKETRKREILAYIQRNPGCTVSQVQTATRSNIPILFGSIVDAYTLAGVKYIKKFPTDGVRNPIVVKRCHDYESRVIEILKNFGQVTPKIRTPAGIIDCLLINSNRKYVVEVKDFRVRSVNQSQLKQLLRYMEALQVFDGLLICPKESFPKRKNGRNIYIGGFSIKIMSDEELRGCSIKEIYSVQPG